MRSVDEITWMEFEQSVDRHFPQWKRRVAIDSNGDVYLPAAMAGDENQVILEASYDASKFLMREGHYYVSSEWLSRAYPSLGAAITIAEMKAKNKMIQSDAGEGNQP